MDMPTNMCRTCLISGGHLVSIFDGKLSEIITAVTSVQISSSDELPKKICLSCVSEVNRAYSFRIKCENSDITLRQFFNEQIQKNEAPGIDEINKQIQVEDEKTPKIENIMQQETQEIQQQELELISESIEELACNEHTSRQMTSIHEELSEILEKGQEDEINDSDSDDNNDNDTEFLDQKHNRESYEVATASDTIYLRDDCNDCQKEQITGDSVQEMEIMDEHNRNESFENETISDKEEETIILGCADCNQTFEDESKFQAHSENCVKEKCNEKSRGKLKNKEPIKCLYCPFDFIHKKNLDKHIKKYHMKNNDDVESVSREDENENQTIGEDYSEALGQEVDIIDLKHNQKILNTPFKCLKCDAGFAKEKSLCFHLKLNKCTEEQFGCVSCKKVFINKENLIQHMKTHSTFPCSKCSKSFSCQDKLKAHIDVEHNGVKNNLCPYCNKVFAMHSSLKDHIRIHSGEKPFLCSLCGKAFSQSTNLKQHMMRHTQTKPFKCNQCDYSFVSKGELNSHVRKHTGDHPFVCDTCSAGFTTSSSLVKHKRRHTGERPYACEYCPMRFSALGILKNHRRTHTGEKPFVCQFCKRSFAQKSDCVSHIRTHTGERPYICSVCGVGFQQSSTLKSHMKSIHNMIYKKDNMNKVQQLQQEEQSQREHEQEQEDEQQKIDPDVLVDILAMQVDNDVLNDSCLKGEILQR